jgi:serine/threonine-protein kinase
VSQTFFDHLKISGLLPPEQLDAVSGRFSNSAADVVAHDLVAQGLLTPFQVQQLEAGQPKGLVLGQYYILDELGRGGYGCVYKARHKLMNRIVALKVIAPERVEDSHARDWFRREVLAATQLTHPNIAHAYDADEVDDILFFAMEYIDGLNLDALVRKRGPLPIGTACEMLLQTAKALQYAHEKGMVHRDIKPANLLIPRDAIAQTASEFMPQVFAGAHRPVLVKVVDFGLARLQNSSATNTLLLQNEKSFVGTPAFVSPEQARNVHAVDIRSDLYSLGCTFYFALAGRQPFTADLPLQIIVQHLEKEADPIEKHRPETPSALASIIRRLMEKKPEKRFQTPAELLSELGFFYSLDRSGMQKTIPLRQLQSDRVVGSEPSLVPCTPVSISCDGSLLSPSEYQHTRVFSMAEADVPSVSSDPLEHASVFPTLCDSAPRERANAAEVASGAPQPLLVPALPVEPPMELDTAAVNEVLLQNWRDWSSVLDDLAAGRAPGLDDMAYRAVHRNVLKSCQGRIPHTGPAQAAMFRQIVDLVQPWLTLDTLVGTDRDTLASIQRQCRAIDEMLGAGDSSVWQWGIAFVLLLLAAAVGFFLVHDGPRFPALPMHSWIALVQRNTTLTLVVGLPAILLAGFFLLKWILRGQPGNAAR